MALLELRKPVPADLRVALPVERCPLCCDHRRTTLHRATDPSQRIPGDFALRRCLACELVYVDPRPSDEQLAALYDEDFYFSTGWAYERLAQRVIDFIQSRRRRRVEQHLPPGRLLDVGCGDGSFVHHMARYGWDATGIDFSPAALAFASRTRSGGRFFHGALESVEFAPASFDLVTMWQVFEHIGEPRPFLRRCHALLRPGGLLVASVPNIEGLSARLTGVRWWGLDVPRHLVHYTPATLSVALVRAGFEVRHIRHRSLQYDPYALLHSTLDWTFSRRHFLSDFAKRHVARDMAAGEYVRNLVSLAVLGPVLAPLCVAVTSAAAACSAGGFIEVHARRA